MEQTHKLTDWLPTTRKELEIRGWDSVDVILFSGDAYVDHPSFGAAVIGRTMEDCGLRVAIVPQPDWRGDFRDFTKLGRPNMFFAVSAGCMDSMVNRYTANRRLRSDDAYTADGQPGARPDYTTITYCNILKKLYPDVPVIIGGIEASMRRLTHYDYWSDKLMPSILIDSKADCLIYGMGEQPIRDIARIFKAGKGLEEVKALPQIGFVRPVSSLQGDGIIRLQSHEDCLKSKIRQAANFRIIDEESNKQHPAALIQAVGNQEVVINPPYPPMTTEQLDASFDLPYTRQPHPKYKGKTIPAYEMIKFSVCLHRGCFGGCSFCAIAAHQGKSVVSRSTESALKEVRKITEMTGFKGYLSDLGGPSANMYRMTGRNPKACAVCKRPSCIHPAVCPNLNADHRPLLELYHQVDAIPGIKKSFIGSGIRYDLLLHAAEKNKDFGGLSYARELIEKHVSGRLKVAPEHTSPQVLDCMRKPHFDTFVKFKQLFDKLENERYEKERLENGHFENGRFENGRFENGRNNSQSRQQVKGRQELIPYFISSHPACHEADMAELAIETKRLNFHLEQVQDFTPTPMTLSTEMYYTGYDPYTLKPVYTARTQNDKLRQRQYFFWYKPSERDSIIQSLRRIGRPDLITRLFNR